MHWETEEGVGVFGGKGEGGEAEVAGGLSDFIL